MRTYLNTVARGHRTWADLKAPSLQLLQEYRRFLQINPDDLGHQYLELLNTLIAAQIPKRPMMRNRSLSLQEALASNNNYPG